MPRLLRATILAALLVGAGYVVTADSARGQPGAPQTVLPPGFQSPCADAREHSIRLPTTVPPSEFVAFEKSVLAFLQSGEYKQLGWCGDKGSNGSRVRDTGPFFQKVYYGTHRAVRLYYSPRVMDWLINGRVGESPTAP